MKEDWKRKTERGDTARLGTLAATGARRWEIDQIHPHKVTIPSRVNPIVYPALLASNMAE